MLRHPIWFIFIFVTSSICVAAGYNAYLMSPLAGETKVDLAGKEDNPLWSTSFLGFEDRQCVQGESERDLFYADEMRSFPPIFRELRTRGGGDVSFNCIREAAKSSELYLKNSKSCLITKEQSAKHCRSFGALPIVYNSILDVADCLEISTREILPLIAVDSAFLPDQIPFDKKNLDKRRQQWSEDRKALVALERPSCKRIAQSLPDFQKGAKELCPSLRDSVIRSFDIARAYAQTSFEIQDKWEAAQIDLVMTEMDARLEERLILRYWVHLLAGGLGADRAIGLARDYLKDRTSRDEKIAQGELSWRGFLPQEERRPASLENLGWSDFVKKNSDAETMARLGRVANWLNWVGSKSLNFDCGAELWIQEQ